MRDTSPEAEARYFELLAAKSGSERLAIAMRLTAMARNLAIASIRAEHPDASERAVRKHLALRLYGAEVAERLFPGAG
jgi:hypothetical protein